MKHRSRLLLLIFLVCGFAALSWCLGGFFSEADVCTHCGATRGVRRWLWIPSSNIQSTPLSRYQESLGKISGGEHHWILVGGGGGPIGCALGIGGSLFRAVDSDEVVSALKSIRDHLGDDTANLWTSRLLDPKTSRDACSCIEPLSAAADNFNAVYTNSTKEFEWCLTQPPGDDHHMAYLLHRIRLP